VGVHRNWAMPLPARRLLNGTDSSPRLVDGRRTTVVMLPPSLAHPSRVMEPPLSVFCGDVWVLDPWLQSHCPDLMQVSNTDDCVPALTSFMSQPVDWALLVSFFVFCIDFGFVSHAAVRVCGAAVLVPQSVGGGLATAGGPGGPRTRRTRHLCARAACTARGRPTGAHGKRPSPTHPYCE
jgi:hypothetical protein